MMYTAIVDGKEVSGYAARFAVSVDPTHKHVAVKCFRNRDDTQPVAIFKMGTILEPHICTHFHCEKFDL